MGKVRQSPRGEKSEIISKSPYKSGLKQEKNEKTKKLNKTIEKTNEKKPKKNE